MQNKAKIIGKLIGATIVFALWFLLAYQVGKTFHLTTSQNVGLSLVTAAFFGILNEIRVSLMDILRELEN